MSQWINKLTEPLVDDEIGIDPKNTDEFYDLKEEINKVTGTDYSLVQEKAEYILQQQGKDLRVAGYLILARTIQDGTLGLSEGLELFSELVTKYGSAIHPQKINSKIASLRWLNDNRIKLLLKQKINTNDKKQLKKLEKLIDKINQQIEKTVNGDVRIFTDVLSYIKAQDTTEAQATVSPVMQKPAANGSVNAETVSLSCESEADLRETTRLQLQYLRQQQQWLRVVAYSRAFRWAALQELRADGNLTTVPAPDQTVIDNFQRVVSNAAPMDVLNAAEDLFMMKGGLYYFDLHYHQTVAARTLGLSNVAAHIEDELKQLLLRFPKLINFSFDNDMPFISSEHRAWLENLLKPVTTGKQSETSAVMSLSDLVNDYRAKVAGKSLAEKISILQKQAPKDKRTYCLQQIAIARFCLEEKKLDLATPILESLAELAEQHQLAEWEPEFALYIWTELSAVWKRQLLKLDRDMQKQLKQKLESLFAKICLTDLGRALHESK